MLATRGGVRVAGECCMTGGMPATDLNLDFALPLAAASSFSTNIAATNASLEPVKSIAKSGWSVSLFFSSHEPAHLQSYVTVPA